MGAGESGAVIFEIYKMMHATIGHAAASCRQHP